MAYRAGAEGVPAIPLHDALIVPASAAGKAKRALEEAFVGQLGVKPHLALTSLRAGDPSQ